MKKINKLQGLMKAYFAKLRNITGLILNGRKYFFGNKVKIITENQSKVYLDDRVWLSDFDAIVSTGKGIWIGKNVYLNANVRIISKEKIVIGENCLFGPNVVIVDHNHKYMQKSLPICKQGFNSIPIEIGEDCWICANVTLCPGAQIGPHIVVAANSVVTSELTIPGVYGGIPATLLKERIDENFNYNNNL